MQRKIQKNILYFVRKKDNLRTLNMVGMGFSNGIQLENIFMQIKLFTSRKNSFNMELIFLLSKKYLKRRYIFFKRNF